MTTAELKEYLGMVVQTEKEVNLQEQLCRQLDEKEKAYNRSIETSMRRIRMEIGIPSVPELKNTNASNTKGLLIICLLTLAATGISYFLADKLELYFFIYIFLLLCLPAFLSLIYLIGIMLGEYTEAVQKDKDEYTRAMSNYQHKCQENEEIKQENSRCEIEIQQLKIQKQASEAYRQQIETSLTSSRQNLEKMYSYNVVFPKYRNYVMVSSLYEYLCAGRCTTLEGHEGAYNILELEIRLDRIITRLDRILQNLAAIQANQYTLYSCLQDSNRKIDTLLREESRMADGLLHLGTQASAVNARLESLQRSSELTSYLTECNQRELHYMNRMNYLAGHYDNPYGNYSPV